RLAHGGGGTLGGLAPGALADIAVFQKPDPNPWRSIIRARERNVRLVIVGGRPAYGNLSLLAAAGARDVEPISVAGVRRGIVMRLPDELLPLEPDLQRAATQSWAD